MQEEHAEQTVVVSHADAFGRTDLLQIASDAGLRDVGAVDTLPDLLRIADLVHPQIVLAHRKTPGLLQVEDVRYLVGEVAPAVVVMVTDEPSSADALMAAGVVAVAPDGDRGALRSALERAVAGLTAERGAGTGRRTGEDRRKVQDWSKVTSERRKGPRRDSADRRDEARGEAAHDRPED